MAKKRKYFDGKSFAIDIFKKRRLVGQINLRQCAYLIGVSYTTLSRLENNRQVPDIETYVKICEWLKTPIKTYIINE